MQKRGEGATLDPRSGISGDLDYSRGLTLHWKIANEARESAEDTQ